MRDLLSWGFIRAAFVSYIRLCEQEGAAALDSDLPQHDCSPISPHSRHKTPRVLGRVCEAAVTLDRHIVCPDVLDLKAWRSVWQGLCRHLPPAVTVALRVWMPGACPSLAVACVPRAMIVGKNGGGRGGRWRLGEVGGGRGRPGGSEEIVGGRE